VAILADKLTSIDLSGYGQSTVIDLFPSIQPSTIFGAR
jgi:hypothetical protein